MTGAEQRGVEAGAERDRGGSGGSGGGGRSVDAGNVLP